jgi:hypothetical protein
MSLNSLNNFNNFAPVRNCLAMQRPWEGNCQKKPWHYKVTAVIPCMDTYDSLEIVVKLLQLQTESPYITIIDTGSLPEIYSKIESLRSENVEVHCLRLNSTTHPSDFPAIAMDLAFSLCRTQYLFATHADVFLKKKTLLANMIDLCQKESPVVGYEISPRSHDDWKGMVSHTATMYHMPTMDKIGFGWSLRRLCNLFNISDPRPNPNRPCWPDTELLGNYLLRKNNITPFLIGKEQNFQRTNDENIDHFRSYTSAKLYSNSYFKMASEWYEEARTKALERMCEWVKE